MALFVKGALSLDVSRAACATAPNPELWFPVSPRGGAVRAARAKAVCETCPIKAECAEFAQFTHATGVWGGRLFFDGKEHEFVDPDDLTDESFDAQIAELND